LPPYIISLKPYFLILLRLVQASWSTSSVVHSFYGMWVVVDQPECIVGNFIVNARHHLDWFWLHGANTSTVNGTRNFSILHVFNEFSLKPPQSFFFVRLISRGFSDGYNPAHFDVCAFTSHHDHSSVQMEVWQWE
jgi:hypothetical protein